MQETKWQYLVSNSTSSVTVQGATLKQFYEEKVIFYILDQQSTFLGHTKSSLDQIELSICLSTAILNYVWWLLKYHVKEEL